MTEGGGINVDADGVRECREELFSGRSLCKIVGVCALTPSPRSRSEPRARIRSSARVLVFGGSSRMGSQPTGGDPGGLMRKLRSVVGTGK